MTYFQIISNKIVYFSDFFFLRAYGSSRIFSSLWKRCEKATFCDRTLRNNQGMFVLSINIFNSFAFFSQEPVIFVTYVKNQTLWIIFVELKFYFTKTKISICWNVHALRPFASRGNRSIHTHIIIFFADVYM